jgi:transcriptional regulator with XRE-family HTH domain
LATTTVHQAREALGQRLRDARRDAGLTGRQLATLAGWHSSKVSKIEYGKQAPAEADIRTWCRLCNVGGQTDDLIIAARDLETMYIEWRRRLRTGTKARQTKSLALENDAQLLRWYEPVLVPGLLHTAEYATEVLRRIVEFYAVPDDVEAGVAARMQRQQILYRPGRTFHFLLAQQALRTRVGDRNIMAGQLDRILSVMTLRSIRLGIIPANAPYRAPTSQFIIFDDRLVQVEGISAELSITQPREVALYIHSFNELAKLAIDGAAARKTVVEEIERLG